MDPIETLKKFLSIYSPSYHEKEAIYFLKDFFNDLGFNVTIDSEGNLLTEMGKGSRSILLCGHVDTIPGLIPLKIEGGKIFARGSVDAKSALVALIYSALNCVEKNLDLRIYLACVVREETSKPGFAELAKRLPVMDYAIFGEPSNTYCINLGYRGRIILKVNFNSSISHSSLPSKNPIFYAANFISSLKEIEKKYSNPVSLFKSLTINPTMINAGISENVIPNRCEVLFDIRIPIGFNLKEFKEEIEEILRRIGIDDVNLEYEGFVPPVIFNKKNELVTSFYSSIYEVINKKPKFTYKSGTSDMNYFLSKVRKGCISYGPGDPRLAHTDKEELSLKDFLDSISIISLALLKL